MTDFWQTLSTIATVLFAGIAVTLGVGNILFWIALRRLRAIQTEIDEVEGVIHGDLDERVAALTEIVDAQRALALEINAELEELDREINVHESSGPGDLEIEAFNETRRRLAEVKRRSEEVEAEFGSAEKQLLDVRRTHAQVGERIERIRRLHGNARWLFRLAELVGNVEIPRHGRS